MISFSQWVRESISNIRSSDRSLLARLFRPLYYVYVATFLSLTQYFPYGTNIYERDWDVLIILDACRVDALQEVSEDYEFITEVNSMRSVGSTSFEWLNHTFTTDYLEEIRRTAYVTGNGYTERVFGEGGETGSAAIPFGPSKYDVISPKDFGYLEELWRTNVTEDKWLVGEGERTRRHPRYTTDRTIDIGRTQDVDRLIVHYLYPHDPYPNSKSSLWQPFDALKVGDVSRNEVWDAYIENLRFVLDDVELLLENIDADNVVITSDHGEAFGEYGFYRHVIGCPLPSMRRVPWVETTATDEETYEPKAPEPDGEVTVSVEDRLAELGYL